MGASVGCCNSLLQLRLGRRLVVVIIFPPPAKRQINNSARLFNLIKSPQGFKQYGPLLQNIAWLTDRMAKGPAQIYGARRFNLFSILSDDRNADGGNSDFFDFSLDQSDRLIADASGRG